MRKLWLLAMLFCGVAVAQTNPTIIGYIQNQVNGQITLATEACQKDPTKRLAFIKTNVGKIGLTGCWQMIGDNVYVAWSDGDLFSYPVGSITFSAEFERWYNENNRKSKYQ